MSFLMCVALILSYLAILCVKPILWDILNLCLQKNRRKNDSYVVSYLYSLVGITLSCKPMYCPSYMYFGKCRAYCTCQ